MSGVCMNRAARPRDPVTSIAADGVLLRSWPSEMGVEFLFEEGSHARGSKKWPLAAAEVRAVRVGRYEIASIVDAWYALDGGAMFGDRPRPLWERKIAPTRGTGSGSPRAASSRWTATRAA